MHPLLVGLGLLLLSGAAVHASPLLSLEPLPFPQQTYAEALASSRAFHEEELEFARSEGKEHTTPFVPLSETTFQRLRDASSLEVLRMTYLSDGLRVTGFIWKPKETEKIFRSKNWKKFTAAKRAR